MMKRNPKKGKQKAHWERKQNWIIFILFSTRYVLGSVDFLCKKHRSQELFKIGVCPYLKVTSW
jgi:hypothetical protein